jgi:DMSO reductase anchor subunit
MIQIKLRKNRYRWKAPAAANFFLGGMGAGLFIMAWMTTFGQADSVYPAAQNYIALISTFLMALGFVAVFIEAGRPLRGIYVFFNVATAWMSREVVFGWSFILLCAVRYFSQATFLSFLAVLCAGLFIFSQAMVLYRSLAITSWQTYLIPALIISADLCAGYGASLLLGWVSTPMLICGIVMMGLHVLLSIVYAFRAGPETMQHKGLNQSASKILLRKDVAIFWLPLFLSLFLLFGQVRDSAPAIPVCGILVIFGVAHKIYSIVCKSVSFRQMTIEKPIPKSFC